MYNANEKMLMFPPLAYLPLQRSFQSKLGELTKMNGVYLCMFTPIKLYFLIDYTPIKVYSKDIKNKGANKMKKYNMSKIMTEAWRIYRMAQTLVNKLSFSDCLRRSWASAKLEAQTSNIKEVVGVTYTWTIGRNRITINTATGSITGGTYPLRETIKNNFPGISWDKQTKAWVMDGAEMQKCIDENEARFTDVYKMEIVKSKSVQTETKETDEKTTEKPAKAKELQSKTVAYTQLVNGNDGFYQVTYYTDGTKSKYFCG